MFKDKAKMAGTIPLRLMPNVNERVDFRKLKIGTLKKYVRLHNVGVSSLSSPLDLAEAVAHHFRNNMHIDEEDTIVTFLDKLATERGDPPPSAAFGPPIVRGDYGPPGVADYDEEDDYRAGYGDHDGDGVHQDSSKKDRRSGKSKSKKESRKKKKWVLVAVVVVVVVVGGWSCFWFSRR